MPPKTPQVKGGFSYKDMRKGQHCTEEMKKKLSVARKGKYPIHLKQFAFQKGQHHSVNTEFKGGTKLIEETRKKISEAMKGRKFSEEHKKNISKSLKLLRRHISEAQKKLLKEYRTGSHLSEETKIKISEGLRGEKNPNWGKRGELSPIFGRFSGIKNPMWGMVSPMKGRHHSEEAKKKLSEAHKGKNNGLIGEKHPNWQGGKSFEPYTTDWTITLKRSIRERDNYTCKICGKIQGKGERVFPVHHIDYNKNNCNPNNLITLCLRCHLETNYNRTYWINYFNGRTIPTRENSQIISATV